MSLSDKEVKIINPNGEKGIGFYFPAGEVKEFIKELKKRIPDAYKVHVVFLIDKLAGEDLK